MRQIDYLHSDYVMRRNGELQPLAKCEYKQAYKDLKQNKIIKTAAYVVIGVACTLLFVALMLISADPVPFK